MPYKSIVAASSEEEALESRDAEGQGKVALPA
jgi:hypothetical protein